MSYIAIPTLKGGGYNMEKSMVILISLMSSILMLSITVFRNNLILLIVSAVCLVMIGGTLVAKALKYNK